MSTTIFVTLEEETCCRADCGVVFGIEAHHRRRLMETHQNFHCPNGHPQHYTGKTEAEKLKDELAREKHRTEQAQADASWQRSRAGRAERKAAAAKGQVTKIRKRAKAGVCLECHRTFTNVADHMAEKHGGKHGQKGPR